MTTDQRTEQTCQTVTRFAPSPTGHLHIGGARTALFCWAFARRHGGRFLLRVEDTDQARSSAESVRGILEDLAWLGIDWDEGPEFKAEDGRTLGGDPRGVGPFYQSQRLDHYNAAIDHLIEHGLAYPAFETQDELEAARAAAIAEKQTYRYDRAALQVEESERRGRMDAGDPHVVRFRMPDEGVTVHDEVLGEVAFGPDEADDFIIRKRDGFPTYHLAVVVDDERMGVTHVLRGQEHLMNTPRHVALQRALGYRVPTYAHMPLIFNADGSKMSKRDKDKVVRGACRDAGFPARLKDKKRQLGSAHLAELAEAVELLSNDPFDAWLEDEKRQSESPPLAELDDASELLSGNPIAASLKHKKRQLESPQLAALADALGLRLPEIDVEDFRRAGYLPDVLCNFVSLLGWNPGDDVEKFDKAFLAQRFDFARIGKSNARFDRAKLMSFNQDAIGAMDDAAFEAAWRAWCERFDPDLLDRAGDRFALLARAVRPRCRTLRDGRDVAAFALVPDDAVDYDGNAVQKVLRKGDPTGLDVLRDLRPVIEHAAPFEPGPIEAAVKAFCDQHSLGMGKAAQPLRVAVTGGTVSPGLGETLALVGRAGCLARIDRCVAQVASNA